MILLLLLCFQPEYGEPKPTDILFLTDEIRAFADENIRPKLSDLRKMEKLVDLIFDKRFLSLTYENDYTRTAVEAFESQSANCLSFTAMFVAMARHVGLTSQFQEVQLSPSWNRKGDVVVLVRHLNAIVDIEGKAYIIDFNPFLNNKVRFTTPISDARAEAHYYNNRGAETYGAGEVETAKAWFELAVDKDPSMSFAWSGLGLVYNRLGDTAKAEEILTKAIEIDESDMISLNNLALFYTRSGQSKVARKMLGRLERYRMSNPFWHYTLADNAISNGDLKEAEKSLKTAIKLRKVQHEFHWLLAQVYLKQGRKNLAERSLARAEKYAPTEFDQNRYAEKLQILTVSNN